MEVPSRRIVVKDALLWALLAFPVALGITGLDPGEQPWWVQTGGLLVLGGAVATSRRHPLASLLLTTVLFAPAAAGELHGYFALSVPVLTYLAGRRTDEAGPALWALLVAFALGSAIELITDLDIAGEFGLILWLVLLGVLPWLAGRSWRQYQELVHAGWERAERLEHEQHILAEQTRLRERARIAQDMHDSLGHDLTFIALRAGALQLAPDLAERHKEAARELRASAAAATERLREIIGVLRDGAEPAETEPVRETISDLINRAEASGMRIELHQENANGAAMPPMIDRAAFRVVQESLTNAAKHAPGAAVTVRLAHQAEEIEVAVINEPAATDPSSQPGHGLTGLRERVRLAGGTLHAGATAAGGFQVLARLPLAAPTALPDGEDAADVAHSESAHQRERAQRRARRGLITAIATTVGLIGALGAAALGYYVYMTFNSVLEPAQFHRLAIGQDRAQVARVLPKEELLTGPSINDPPIPAGASCEYYRPDANLLGLSTVYRVCFKNDRLVAKDAIQASARTQE